VNNQFAYPDEIIPANEPAGILDDSESFVSVVASVEAEQALIGGLSLDPGPIHDVMEIVSESDFYRSEHRDIFAAMASVIDDGNVIDVISVSEKMQSMGKKPDLKYLTELAGSAAGSANALAYAKIVFERSIKRQVLASAAEVTRYVLKTPDATAEQVVNQAQAALVDLDDRSDRSTRAVTVNEALRSYVNDLDDRFRNGSRIQGFESGFTNVDRTINGWKRGHLIIIAGRPSMGKSTYALQLASHLSIRKKLNGLFFSLEMSQNELTEKMIACVGKINLECLQRPQEVTEEGFWPSVQNAAGQIKDSPIAIVESPGIHINQVKSYARKAHRRHKLDWIMVDHAHIMGGDGHNREQEISGITKGFKQLAVELQIPVFLLAQLNRDLEKRKFADRAPRLSDLRDSGGMEQDADIVQFIFRPDYYNDNPHKSNDGLIQVETAKHRNGRKGIHTFINHFDQSRMEEAPFGSFVDLSAPQAPQQPKSYSDRFKSL
jgi:replicative DNA helicase